MLSRRHCLLLWSVLAFTAFCRSEGAGAETLNVMSYNVRFASAKPPNAWPDRRPLVEECIRSLKPDIIGTQEGVYQQLKDMAADLPEYRWIGTGRDGGSRGEFMAIFYQTDRFDALEYDHFWLSDTPEVIGSTTWGNKNKRMVTWIKFRDLQTKREFYVVNTHFDHQVQAARMNSARLVRERINALNTTSPVFLIGDFNAVAGSNPAYDHLAGPEGGFKDSWITAETRKGEGLDTFNGFKEIGKQGRRIDWILYRGPVTPLSAEIIPHVKNGQFPSDHNPVMTRFRFEAAQ